MTRVQLAPIHMHTYTYIHMQHCLAKLGQYRNNTSMLEWAYIEGFYGKSVWYKIKINQIHTCLQASLLISLLLYLTFYLSQVWSPGDRGQKRVWQEGGDNKKYYIGMICKYHNNVKKILYSITSHYTYWIILCLSCKQISYSSFIRVKLSVSSTKHFRKEQKNKF